MSNEVEITSLGVRKTYGPRDTEHQVPGRSRTAGETVEVVVDFNYENLPAVSEDDNLVLKVPANAFIVSSRLYVSTPFDSTSGTTTLDVGLTEPDGTAIDPNGLHAADVTADGADSGWKVGAGALVGAGIGAEDGQIVVAPSVADLTAGVAKLVVEYVKPD